MKKDDNRHNNNNNNSNNNSNNHSNVKEQPVNNDLKHMQCRLKKFCSLQGLEDCLVRSSVAKLLETCISLIV